MTPARDKQRFLNSQEAPKRLLRDSPEAPGRSPGSSQEAAKATMGNQGIKRPLREGTVIFTEFGFFS